MKKLLFLPIILLSFGLVFSAGASINIGAISVSDSSIYPGGSGSISFTVTNDGGYVLSSVVVALSSQLTLGNAQFIFTNLGVGESRFVSTSYSASNAMLSGTYSIQASVLYSSGGTSYNNQAGTIIKVAQNNKLIVSDYTTNLVIDNTTSFKINLTNQGNNNLENVFVELILPDGFIPSTGSQFFIPELKIGESKLLSSNIFIEKSIEPDSYQFTLNKSANNYNNLDTLNVAVTGVPKLAFSGMNFDPEIPSSGELETISIQFENIGSGTAYNITAELIVGTEVTGVTLEHLGTLERDDLTSAIFDFYLPAADSLGGIVKIV